MLNIAEIKGHVALEVNCVDRLYLNPVAVPQESLGLGDVEAGVERPRGGGGAD